MPELLDVVNENDKVIGREIRENVHGEGLWHRGIHVFVFDSRGRLLVEKRSPTKDKYPGYYGCSVSEHSHAGENFDETLSRALKEELGIDIKSARPRELCKIKIVVPGDRMIDKFYELFYDGRIDISSGEDRKTEFLSLKEIRDSIKSGKRKFAPWFLKLFRWYVKNRMKDKL